MIDAAKVRREATRWHILTTLDTARPVGCHEETILQVIQSIYPDTTRLLIQRSLDYLEDRGLVEIDKRPDGVWWAELTRCGVDMVEYNIDCKPGIARPQRG